MIVVQNHNGTLDTSPMSADDTNWCAFMFNGGIKEITLVSGEKLVLNSSMLQFDLSQN